MIRYQPLLDRTQLEARIDAHDASWRQRAAQKTMVFVANGKFVDDGGSIWSDVKPVYMRLQYDKCIYCERVLGAELTGKSEHDVEHYRPKGRVQTWPYPRRKPPVNYSFGTGTPNDTGYYWLAYDIENYACSCKGCNSDRKRDYFPILGARAVAPADIPTLNATEVPLLLFPGASSGDDPAQFITYEGVVAQVHPEATGIDRQRAQITIDFFSLNDREELLADRARVIRELAKAMRQSVTDPDPVWRQSGRRDIDQLISDASPQSACARAYLALAKNDTAKASEIYHSIERYLTPRRKR